jgi:hypothetical protein
MTREKIIKEIAALTSEIRTLSYSSTKAAAEKILQLQLRRRELRTQLEGEHQKSGETTHSEAE